MKRMSENLTARIRDRLNVNWLTPSQKQVWEHVQQFDGPLHRVINIYGAAGTGKTFLGWLMERLDYAAYSTSMNPPKPLLPRLILDDMTPDRSQTRSIRPLVDQYNIRQLILLSRNRVDELAMPAFELAITEDDIQVFRANFYRHLGITIPEVEIMNYQIVLDNLT
jgi:hypothetical protein